MKKTNSELWVLGYIENGIFTPFISENFLGQHLFSSKRLISEEELASYLL